MPNMPSSRNWFSPVPPQRHRRFAESRRHGVEIELDGRRLVNFASNDYLGLSHHPSVIDAAIAGLHRHGVGSGASRLVSGDDPELHRLERELAAWKGHESCLIVGSGMLANIGLMQALADRHTHIFADRLNHASLLDGIRLSGAHLYRYRHLDTEALARQLQQHREGRKIIVSDGVFSMDGDCADVETLMRLADEHDGLLILDDAHGIGTVGDGRGLTAGRVDPDRLIEVGTFGKAFGVYGAFILASREIIDGLRQRLRTMIYSTALPPALIAAAGAALELIRQGELTMRLQAHVRLFRRLAPAARLMDSDTAIQPLIIGEDEQALKASGQLAEAGFFVPAIRPPTVPEGTARLRITLSAAHDEDQIAALCDALKELP